MFQKPCRLTLADKYFMGGGGSVDVPSTSMAIGETTRGFQRDVVPAYRQFAQHEPLLREARNLGLGAIRGISPYLTDVLSHPYDLPPELRNMATQSARGAFQARGNVLGNQAIGAEILNRENARQQRINQALLQSGQAEQLAIQPEQAQIGAFSSLMNPLYGLAAAQLGAQTQAGIAGQAAEGANKAGMGQLGGAVIGAAGIAI
jgi:hypothetical protein